MEISDIAVLNPCIYMYFSVNHTVYQEISLVTVFVYNSTGLCACKLMQKLVTVSEIFLS